MTDSKVTAPKLLEMKSKGEKIAVLTAYDYPSAKLADKGGLDVVLVGDSLGNVILGYENTLPVTMEEMLHHVKAVARGLERALLVADMPFLSYQISAEEAVFNAGRFVKEAGAEAVKLEGGGEVTDIVRRIVDVGIPVMGHVGMTPQSVNAFGGFALQGKTEESAVRIIEGAKALQEAGAFAVVLEKIPAPLAKQVTEAIEIPTIGIGAGVHCDGQVLVMHDMLGLYQGPMGKFVKQYAKLGDVAVDAMKEYASEVKSGEYPGEEHSY